MAASALLMIVPTLGEVLSGFRSERNMSRAVFAKRSGVDPSTVYNIEKGKTDTLRTEQFERVAKLMGKTAEELRKLTNTDEKFVPIVVERTTADRIRSAAEKRKIPVAEMFDLMLEALERPVKGSSSKTRKAEKQASPPPPAPEQPQSPGRGGKA